MDKKLTEDDIKNEALAIITLEAGVAEAEQKLMANVEFKNFLQLQREVNTKAAVLWKQVEAHMIDNNIKNVSGDWGWLTIAEGHRWVTTDELQKKFIKTVIDTTKLTDTFKLTGKEPKGALHTYTYYLTKRLKG